MVSFLPMCGIKQKLFSLGSYAVIMRLSVIESSPIGPVRIELVTQAGYPSNPPSTLKSPGIMGAMSGLQLRRQPSPGIIGSIVTYLRAVKGY
jgi:hypothetical protein